MKIKQVICSVVTAGIVAFGGVSGAKAENHGKDVVIDRHGHPVLDSQGDCVLTKWDSADSQCGVTVPPALSEHKPIPRQILRQLMHTDRVIYFEFDSAKLTPAAERRLAQLASLLHRASEIVRVKVVGYADELGTNEYNKRLSERRAHAVKSFLMSRSSVDARVADVRALGERSSMGKCEGVKGKQAKINCLWQDRRVEIELEYIH